MSETAKCGRAGRAPEHTSLAGSRLDEHDAIERYTAAGRKVEVTEFPVDFRTLVWLHLTCDDLTPLAVVRTEKGTTVSSRCSDWEVGLQQFTA